MSSLIRPAEITEFALDPTATGEHSRQFPTPLHAELIEGGGPDFWDGMECGLAIAFAGSTGFGPWGLLAVAAACGRVLF